MIIPCIYKTNQKVLGVILLIFIVFYSCSKENAETPQSVIQLIQSLKSENTDCTCSPYLNQYLWRNKTVYVLGYKGPTCNWFPIFYDSSARKITLQNGYTFEEFIQESILEKNVWTCK